LRVFWGIYDLVGIQGTLDRVAGMSPSHSSTGSTYIW
jgi:hypothetical protein